MTFLAGLSDIALAVVALSLAGALGLALGHVKIRGVGLGVGGVLFAGILVGDLAGRAGLDFEPHVMEFVREFGLILFVYAIGVQVGPGFFASLRRSGLTLNLLAAAIVLLGVATALAMHFVAGVDAPAAIGIMSGAVTNTPGLGAATQALKDLGVGAETAARPALGYAVAYPFGILGILLTIVAIRAALRIDVPAEALAHDAENLGRSGPLPAMNVVVRNPNYAGVALSDVPGLGATEEAVACSRLLRNGALSTPAADVPLALGDVLHLVGPEAALRGVQRALGEETDITLTTTQGTDMTWERVAVTATRALGRRLRHLRLDERLGVRLSRVERAGTELVARGDLALAFGDVATVVGPQEGVAQATRILGGDAKRLGEVDFRALFIGIALGVLVGSIPIAAPGMPAPLKLGLAGGPLVVAILLSRLGSFRGIVWFTPPAANHALRELGIALFLATVGIVAGDRFLATLASGDGLLWLGYGALITLIPLVVVGFFARIALGVNYLTLSGLLAGSMTDPPALAFANALNPSPAAALGYATVYPLVMFLRILAPQAVLLFLLA